LLDYLSQNACCFVTYSVLHSSMSAFTVSTYMCIGDVGYDGDLDSLCNNDTHECYSERRRPLELPCTNWH